MDDTPLLLLVVAQCLDKLFGVFFKACPHSTTTAASKRLCC